MKVRVAVHEAEEGGYWPRYRPIPACATEGETFEELVSNLQEAIEGCLSVEVEQVQARDTDRVIEITV